MAGRILNRRELRKQTDQAESQKAVEPNGDSVAAPAKKGAKAKAAAAAPKARKPRKKKEPVRMRARWGVFDGGMKQVAIFDYNQRAAADEKVSELTAKKKGIYFLQVVKDAMPEPAPVEAPVA